MRRPRFTVRLLLAAIVGVAIALGVLIGTRDRIINRSNYNRIRLGMTRSAVDELLGATSVDLAPLNFDDVAFDESPETLLNEYPPPHTIRHWKGDKYLISVIFDKHGRVGAKYYERTPDASVIDRIADWLGI